LPTAWLALKMDAARQKERNIELKGLGLVRPPQLFNTKKKKKLTVALNG